ncbi:hypothetical protein OHB26_34840 [Nocardia sp. NBC_01503]|uniref:hypothetical protein n=1 Tax=Nocardia sp. NBC_01503 TaxID=2975997 RepID=UPI002E7B04AD|nr:hypothetical protein [Nocardia sp. NBC_01503]WTL32018.1 hypothetical protein OHB26_34840 [Nocardia sp. NBC_01503]
MAVRLAWGVIADRGRGVWLAETGERVDARDHELPAGAAVVLGDLEQLCAEALDSNRVGLAELWSAVNNRPLVATLAALDPALLARYPRLHALTADAPLPSKVLRELVRAPELAVARSMDLVSLRLRGVIAHMAMTDDPVFARALTRRPSPEVICPFAIAITSAAERPYPVAAISEPSAVTVTGFPATALNAPEGPWERHLPAATEFGGGIERFWEQTAETGVLVPNSWLSTGGWQGLWGRSWSHTALV